MKILIVDDSRSDRLSIKRSLRRHSAIELEFEEESVGEKIFQYDLSLFDGLIFDFHLRETTGLDLLKKLRAKSDLLPCPVVVVTGSASEDMGARCLEAGAHDYIDKDRLSEPSLWRALKYAQSRYQIHSEIAGRALELEYLNRELATKSQLKSELLASTTHELRTPVSAITGLIELLKAEELNKQSMDYVRQIGLCCNALNNSINDVLDLSKIEAGEFRVQSSVFSPQVLLSEVVDALKMLAQNKSLVLKHETQGLPSYLKGDARRIQQLLINYGSNALKFTQAGFVCFRAYQVGDTEQVRFEVEDTGCGIPQEEAARVFERHYQAANQDFEGAELGTGLGLSIVKEIVAQLGGICGCRSQVGVGSVFWFELRLPSVNEASTEAVEVLSGETRGQSKTVLLAEDNAILAQIFQNQIKKLGHQVVTTNNGVEALEAFDPDTIDLVVFDARMPRMGGFEASAALRTKFPEWQGPVYILTADATIPVQEQGEHGVTKVFVKPMNMDDLKRLIKSS